MTIASSDFLELAEQASMNNAGAKMSFVVVSHPVAGIGREAAMEKAEKAFPDLLEAATKWTPPSVDEKALKQEAAYPASTLTFKGTTAELSQMFIDKGWSEGIPITPPTPDKVEEMLKGTTRKPDEVIWTIPPRNGVLTVELVATYAVMAGCKPSYMPVLISALEGLKDPDINWLGLTTTTHPNGVLVVVNGPIAKKIGLASGMGAAGGQYQANTAIGYAISLITDVVGGSKSPLPDKTTLGWSGNTIATVIAENVDDSPWEPYSVEKGFNEDDNLVTVYSGGPPLNVADHSSPDADGLLKTFANSITYSGQNSVGAMPRDVIILLNPEFAEQLSKAGFTKAKFKEWLFENGRKPAGDYPAGCAANASKNMGITIDDSTPVPIVSSPDHFAIFIAGGAGRHAQYWPSFVSGKTPTNQPRSVITVEVKN